MSQPIVIPMEDKVLHTQNHPTCHDSTCPCHLQAVEGMPPLLTEHAYATEVLRTYDGTEEQKLCLGALGLAGETGEVADLLKKHLFQGHPLNRDTLLEELSDVLWYAVLICTALGCSLQDVMQRNVAKLRERYPDGFAVERSLARETSLKGGKTDERSTTTIDAHP